MKRTGAEGTQTKRSLEKVIGGSRAAVLRALEGGVRSVGEVVAATGLSQPNVSNHLARLREQGLVTPRREGKNIYYSVTDPDVVHALLSLSPERALSHEEIERALQDLAPAFERLTLSLDHEGARVAVDRALAQGVPWQDLYLRVFQPLLVRIGDLWACGYLSISEEHAASQLMERLMSHIASLRIPAPSGGQCQVVVACVEGEHHQIGARMLADFLASEGWSVVFLGGNVPTKALLPYLERYKPAVLALSAATPDREAEVRECVIALRESGGHQPRLLLGGGLFTARPALAADLGVDAAPASPDAVLQFLEAATPVAVPE